MTNERRPLDEVLQDGMPAAPTFGERVFWDHVMIGLGLRLRFGSPSTWIYRRRVEGKLIKESPAKTIGMNWIRSGWRRRR